MQSSQLNELLQHHGIRRGYAASDGGHRYLATGFSTLDGVLPGGGWPLGRLTEVLYAQAGIGELRLVMPALARLSREGRGLMWVTPPFVPYAPALLAHGIDLSRLLLVCGVPAPQALWAAEQGLRAGLCGAVLLWARGLDQRQARRMQLAAETGNAWAVVFQHEPEFAQAEQNASPASLRLKLHASPAGVMISMLKCRGRAPREPMLLAGQPSLCARDTAPAVSPSSGRSAPHGRGWC